MEVQAVKTMNTMQLVDEFTSADLNNNLMDAANRNLTTQTLIYGNTYSLVAASNTQITKLSEINETLNMMYLDSKEVQAAYNKINTGLAEIVDNTEPQEIEDEVKGGASEKEKSESGGIGDMIDSAMAFLALGMKEKVIVGLKSLGKSILGTFKYAGKAIKAIVFDGPVKIVNWIGDIFKPIGKIIGKLKKAGGLISKVFKPVMSAIKWIGNIFKPLKNLLPVMKASSGFIKTLGPIGVAFSAIFAIFDAFSGWANASDITGKAKSALSIGDKAMAAFASVISGITEIFTVPLNWIGIKIDLSPKVIYEKINGMFTWVKEKIMAIPEFLSDVVGFLGDVFSLKTIMPYIDGMRDFMLKPLAMLFEPIKQAFALVGDIFSGKDVDIAGRVKELAISAAKSMLTPFITLFDGVKLIFTKLTDLSLTDMLPESFKGSWLGKKVVSMLGDASPVADTSSAVTPIANTMGNTDAVASKTLFNEQRALAEKQSQQPMVRTQVEIVDKPVPVPSRRVGSVDDPSINFMNMAPSY